MGPDILHARILYETFHIIFQKSCELGETPKNWGCKHFPADPMNDSNNYKPVSPTSNSWKKP